MKKVAIKKTPKKTTVAVMPMKKAMKGKKGC
jgi:hypothetical protein